jgi:hypothetical protein
MNEGDVITVLAEDPSGWWKGELNGVVATFPSNFTEPCTADGGQDELDVDDGELIPIGKGSSGPGGALTGAIGLGSAINAEMAAKLQRRAAGGGGGGGGGAGPAPNPAAVATPPTAPLVSVPTGPTPAQIAAQQ